MSQLYFFRAFVSVEDCERYYQGQVIQVIVTTEQGLRIQLPFKYFRPFISKVGIRGYFRLSLDSNGRLQRLEKIS
ncbi:DUF2835 family protein [Arsukibacterium sp.]|uniref:DUF2835 family protein n=1 Tax=Arsukibacterium sp. TaxID=1977258 RepID=UPI002FD890CB